MEETCIVLCFETTDLCFGCGHVDRISKTKKTVLAKNAFLNKTRARKNICIQPWHQKFKTASKKQSGIRDMLIGKYDKLSAMLPNNLDVVVNNFKRNKVTLGKQTLEINRLTVAN